MSTIYSKRTQSVYVVLPWPFVASSPGSLGPQDHRRKKKFHGASCNTAKQTLSALSEYPLDCLVETSDPSAILCHACERTLTTIHSLEAKVVSMKEDVKRLLSSLQIAGVVSLGKRSRPGYHEPEVPPKRAHVAQSRASDSESVVQLHAAPSTSSQSVSACSSASPPLTVSSICVLVRHR